MFRAGRRVRLADADPTGRLRLDSCARYLQDIGNDDTADSRHRRRPPLTWVVRRAVVDVHRPPRWREWLDLATWCGGLGGRWAERRLSMVGEQGGRIEISTLWIQVSTATDGARPLTDRFLDAYGEAAGGRKVSSRLWLGDPPVGAAAEPWPLRAVDIDLLGHVNNAAYWAAVEEQIEPGTAFAHALLGRPHRAVMEYGPGIAPAARSSCWSTRTTGTCRCGSRCRRRAGRRHRRCRCPPAARQAPCATPPDGGASPTGRSAWVRTILPSLPPAANRS